MPSGNLLYLVADVPSMGAAGVVDRIPGALQGPGDGESRTARADAAQFVASTPDLVAGVLDPQGNRR
jgi:hypothetical protein